MWEIEFTNEFGAWWDLLSEDERPDLMAKNSKELEAGMRPESLARAKTRAKEMMAEMLLSEIRRTVGLTQEQLAVSLGIKQPSLSRLEAQDDMQISTLRRLVAALGGELEIIARLPGGAIRITQFQDAA
jgi:DNA-binding XRE family transcriptional regulator